MKFGKPVKNNTNHKINLFALENHYNDDDDNQDHFMIDVGDSFHVPIALMERTAGKGGSLGFLKMKVRVDRVQGTVSHVLVSKEAITPSHTSYHTQ